MLAVCCCYYSNQWLNLRIKCEHPFYAEKRRLKGSLIYSSYPAGQANFSDTFPDKT